MQNTRPLRPQLPTILIVEDEPLLRLAMSDHLQDAGFKTIETGAASRAVEILGDGHVRVDLIVTDVRMPGAMDGFELTRWARENRPGLPVIMVSGHANRALAIKELPAAELFFAKPYDLERIVTTIREMLGSKHTEIGRRPQNRNAGR